MIYIYINVKKNNENENETKKTILNKKLNFYYLADYHQFFFAAAADTAGVNYCCVFAVGYYFII